MDPTLPKYMLNPTQLAVSLANTGQCQLNKELIAATKHMLDKVAKVIADRISHTRHELKQKVLGSTKKSHGDAHNLPPKEFALFVFPPPLGVSESVQAVDAKIERAVLLRAHRNKRSGYWQAIDKELERLDKLRSGGRGDEARRSMIAYITKDNECSASSETRTCLVSLTVTTTAVRKATMHLSLLEATTYYLMSLMETPSLKTHESHTNLLHQLTIQIATTLRCMRAAKCEPIAVVSDHGFLTEDLVRSMSGKPPQELRRENILCTLDVDLPWSFLQTLPRRLQPQSPPQVWHEEPPTESPQG